MLKSTTHAGIVRFSEIAARPGKGFPYLRRKVWRWRSLRLLVSALCSLLGIATVQADVCLQHHYDNPELARCQGSKCPASLLTPPNQFPGLKLLAACDYHMAKDAEGAPPASGAFFFRGEQVVSGVLRREASEFIDEFTLLGATVTSWPEKPPLFFRGRVHLQFPDASKAEKAFSAPKPDGKTSCWEARVKLKITEMLSVFGWDNSEGDYPQKYTVLELGAYRKCPEPTPE